MQHNVYIYILVMGIVTYLIRVLPLTLIRKEIKNRFIRSFLYYVPYVTLAVMTFPGDSGCDRQHCFRTGCFYCRYPHRMVWWQPFSGGCHCLCGSLCLRNVYMLVC